MAQSKKSKKLLVVESPAKAKTIKKFLGKDFDVKASVGHIRDLKGKGRGNKAFGIDIENNYAPEYQVIKGKEKTVSELKAAAAKASEVYLAPDPDREGEAIAWHLKEVMNLDLENARRVTYQAVTKKAVLEAMENPRQIDMDLVNAQQGRRVLDRLVGFNLSPFLWKKVAKNLSAGRVQSVAVRIVCEREAEIKAFNPEEYWKITAAITADGKTPGFDAALVKWKGEKFALGNKAACEEGSVKSIADILTKAEYKLTSVESKDAKGKTAPPFITSTLQQSASSELRYNTSRTMRIAQKLYEGTEVDGAATGLITYMRTDSTRIDPEALNSVREYIGNNFDKEYLPEKAVVYSSKKNAQDAHEAIRPVSVDLTPDKLKPILTDEQYKLYELIWRRFVASQMNPAQYRITTLKISADEGQFEAKGRQTLFRGNTILVPENKTQDQKYQPLPALEESDTLSLNKLTPEQFFTKPPARFSEASLVRFLEKEGIGRPSTYAPIVQTIRDRGYVRLEKRAFHATELGMAVNNMLVDNFEDVMDLKFTAGMESGLDEVEQGNKDWVQLVDEFYKPFLADLDKATEHAVPLKGRPWEGDEKCPVCGSGLLIRYSKNGAFLGCDKYPECKGLLPMPGEGSDSEDGEEGPQVDCPECGSPMIMKKSRYGKPFLACTKYPECKTTMSVDKDGKPVEVPKVEGVVCDLCGKNMEVKMGRRGPFLACSGYPGCKNTKPLDKEGKPVDLPKVEGEVCEKCGSEMVVKMGRRGAFLACSGYPKCKNAKPLPGEKGEEKDEKKDKKEE